jgi:hypothetical protein
MTRLAPISALAAALLLGAAALADEISAQQPDALATDAEKAADDRFEPVDPESLETVSGASLMIAAYAIIVGAIMLYCLVLMLRERGVHRSIRKLEQQLNRQAK